MTALEQRARLVPTDAAAAALRPWRHGRGAGDRPWGSAAAVQGRRVGLPGSGAGPGAGRRRVGPGPGRDRHPDRPRRGPAGWGVAARGGRRRRGRGWRLPGPGELQPRCSCPDWADPCKHAAAVCYLVAGALDADPFSLLLLRGRRREEVLAAAAAAPRGDRASRGRPHRRPTRGVNAARPTGAPAPPLARRCRRSDRASRRCCRSTRRPAPAYGRGRDLAALADAAARAFQLATGSGDGGLSLDLEADLAAAPPGLLGTGRGLAALAASADMPSRELLEWAVTWRRTRSRRAGRAGRPGSRGHDLVEDGPRSTGSAARCGARLAQPPLPRRAPASAGRGGQCLVCPLRQRLDPRRPRGAEAKCARGLRHDRLSRDGQGAAAPARPAYWTARR